jgi:prephenate dehydrogenase
MRIGIIGGKGKMGTWMAGFFSGLGHKVEISDTDTELSNDRLTKQADIVVLATPVRAADKVIEEITPALCSDQLLIDVFAVKQPTIKAMTKTRAEILSIHPIFNPSFKSVKGQTVIVCDVRTSKWKGRIEKLFLKKGAKVKTCSIEEHDWMMSIIQGMMHFSLISLGHAIGSLGVNVEKSLEFSSPIYRIRTDMVGRVLSQNPKVYADISIENPDVCFSVDQLMRSSVKLNQIIKDKDHEAFEKYFSDAAKKFGKYRTAAAAESDNLIRYLVKAQN